MVHKLEFDAENRLGGRLAYEFLFKSATTVVTLIRFPGGILKLRENFRNTLT